jgi:hypothetical protein
VGELELGIAFDPSPTLGLPQAATKTISPTVQSFLRACPMVFAAY